VAEKTVKTIRIKWVRSGIGFTYHQKTIVRSLGLNKLNHTVVRPDTPQIRGVVASVPHLLEIVPEPPAAAWASIPEYTIHAPAVTSASVEPTEGATTGAAGVPAGATDNAPASEASNADQVVESPSQGSDPAAASKE
jgi:large subunit ribosomal protein L30